jgi:CRP-like cAMP-binding protein
MALTPRSRTTLQSFYERIDTDHQLTPHFKRLLEEQFTEAKFAKGEVVYFKGETVSRIHLNVSGVFRFFDPQQDTTLGFAKPLALVPALGSLNRENRLSVTVMALSPCQTLAIPQSSLEDLVRADFRWYRVLWNLLQEETMTQEALRLSLLLDPAPVRYKKFLAEFGEVERHIRIQHVASYLGMNPATLSRIRSRP